MNKIKMYGEFNCRLHVTVEYKFLYLSALRVRT